MFRQYNKLYLCFLISIISILIWSKYNCYSEIIWWLEAMPVLIAIPILILTYHKFRFTNLSYCLIWAHCVILLVGAHYTYEHVPLFDHLRDLFHLSRNHYDRVGHFAQGFVPAIIARELLLRTSALKAGKWLTAIIILSILGISALYEIFEMVIAVTTSQESAYAFLGIQGDVWDTQKDMALAGIGACLSIIFLSKLHDKELSYYKNL